MIDMSGVENVVIRLPNWVGDAVMAQPAVNCIKRHFPHLRISCLGKPAVNELYRHNPNVDRLIDFRLPRDTNRLSGIKEFSRDLRVHRFDLGVILPDSFSSALVFRAANVRIRAGYRSELRSLMLTHPVKRPSGVIHRFRRYTALIEQVLGVEGCGSDVSVPLSGEVFERADRLLAGIERFAVICPTSRAPSRRWGERKYAELMRRIAIELNLGIVLVGSGDESQIVEDVGRLSGVRFANLAVRSDILLSVAVMRRSAIFVGNDSGAAHLAAASGTRVVSISGADDPRVTRPLARVAAVVNKNIECSPCVKNICPRDDHVNECMDVISVDDVFGEVVRILGREK
jgi:heptosyltransferase-2